MNGRIFLFLLLAHTTTAVDWASLTFSTLSVLSPSEFSTISAQNLSSIPANAFEGFSAAQIAALPVSAAPGFSADQVSNFNCLYYTDDVSGFKADVLAAVLPSAFSGFSAGCLGIITSDAYNQVSAAQMAQIKPAAMVGFKASISGINPAAFSGFNKSQISNLYCYSSTDSVGNLQASQIGNMSADGFSGFTEFCLRILPVAAIPGINSTHIASSNSISISGFNGDQIAKLTAESGKGWSADILSGVSSIYFNDGCGGFQPDHVANMQPATFAGWEKNCVKILPITAWNQTTASQISYLLKDGAQGLTAGVVKNMPGETGAGWMPTTLNNVAQINATDGCAGFTAQQVGNMTTAAFGAWSKACVSLLPNSAFSSTSSLQIANFSTDGATGARGPLIAGMPAEAAAGWTIANLNATGISYNQSGCSGFTVDQFNNIPLSSYPGWTKSCMFQLSTQIFAAINTTQLSTIPDLAYDGLSDPQIRAIPDNVITSMTFSGLMSMSSVNGLSANKLSLLVMKYGVYLVNGFQYQVISSYYSPEILAFKSLVPNPVPALLYTMPNRPTWLQMVLTKPSNISLNMVTNFTSSSVCGITAKQAALMDDASIEFITTQFPSSIFNDTMSGWNCQQLQQVYNVYNMTHDTVVEYNKQVDACRANSGNLAASTITTSSGYNTGTATGTGTGTGTGSNTNSNTNTHTGHSSSSGKGGSGKHIGTIVGISGGVLALGVVVVIFFVWKKRSHSNERAPLIA